MKRKIVIATTILSLFLLCGYIYLHRGMIKTWIKNEFVISGSKTTAKLFNDSQSKQLSAAKKNGIKPLSVKSEISPLYKAGKLTKVRTCNQYKIAYQSYGYPYLVPVAAKLLKDIGERFQEISGTDSRIIATSELRTIESVKRLQKGNVNAVKNSCHMYGTTFDISYVNFDNAGGLTDRQLYDALESALKDMRAQGRCYVKYEVKQLCFHITVRK